jgi:hypothetical protein
MLHEPGARTRSFTKKWRSASSPYEASTNTYPEGDGRRTIASIDIDRNQWRTAILVGAPAVLLPALVAHPYLSGRIPNDSEVAEAVASGTTRGAW